MFKLNCEYMLYDSEYLLLKNMSGHLLIFFVDQFIKKNEIKCVNNCSNYLFKKNLNSGGMKIIDKKLSFSRIYFLLQSIGLNSV